ncbi:MAG: pilus assembly protein [Proteobacteria bacterium]|nr:pilus assembly protein [Pseudomonadota bacterium]
MLKRFVRADQGTAAIEFAIVGNVFMMFLVAIAYFGIMMWDESSLDWAVQKGARMAALDKTVTQSQIATAVNGYLTSIGMSNATVSYSVAASNGVNVATISANLTKAYSVPFFSNLNLTFSSSAAVPQS